MHLAHHWEMAVGAVAALAAAAWAVRAVTWDGAVAGLVVGAAVSLGFGVPGLVVLGTFFVVGSVATKAGWARKAARGTAEATGGARGAARVLGKGGVAAALGIAATFLRPEPIAFVGAVAAALADTLGTEIGSMSTGRAWRVPQCRAVPHGTPGAVSVLGLGGALLGTILVIVAADLSRLPFTTVSCGSSPAPAIVLAGVGGSLLESVAVGVAPRAARVPGWVRNVLTTVAGAAIARAVYTGLPL